MALVISDVWAELQHALDELNTEPRGIRSTMTEGAKLLSQADHQYFKGRFEIGDLHLAYSKAKMRSDARNAHEAIEKGLKTILVVAGFSESQLKSLSHSLDRLLNAVKRENATAFSELARCFKTAIDYLELVTSIRHEPDIVEYFQEHGRSDVFIANRYTSIVERYDDVGGMIHFVYTEVIRSLLSLIFGSKPKDIYERIEEEMSRIIVGESETDPTWDATQWLGRGSIFQRLQNGDPLQCDDVLRAALRTCGRESADRAIRHWAERVRRKVVYARKKEPRESRVE